MSLLASVRSYAHFAWGLRDFLHHTLTLEEAQAIVCQRLAERERNFLRLVERGIFGYARSPYLPLLHWAGCEFGDIQNMVRTQGLEGTLRALREAGIYVTFEEFKGREPIVRSGLVLPVHAHDFDNPYLGVCYEAETGGTSGAGTRVRMDLDHLAALSPYLLLTQEAHGLRHIPVAHWYGTMPAASGTNNVLIQARLGHVPEKWFSPFTSEDLRPSLKYYLFTQFLVTMCRVLGTPIPRPQRLKLDQAIVLARWAAKTLETHGACLIRTHVSMALRVCLAAQEAGLSLAGATFMGGGEPPTPAKVLRILSTGARWVPTYWFTESGPIGLGCARPADGNDVHFFKDGLALIQHPIQVPGSETTVDAFYFTSLLPTAPKLMLNVENDDYGVIETRSCGCELESYGFTEHLRHVHSFRKLTGEGVTLVGSEMVRILEEVLPARFGGSPLDYQVIEEEDPTGFTRLSLLVSPRIELPDESIVIETVLQALRQSSAGADVARTVWSQAKTLRIKRAEPRWTAQGKFMPLHVEPR